ALSPVHSLTNVLEPAYRKPVRSVLPAVMGKGLVGLGHPVGVFLLLNCGALVGRSVQNLIGEPFRHPLLSTQPGVLRKPPQAERYSPLRTHFYGHLVGRTAHPSRLHFKERR